jgi:hypothetical protein
LNNLCFIILCQILTPIAANAAEIIDIELDDKVIRQKLEDTEIEEIEVVDE